MPIKISQKKLWCILASLLFILAILSFIWAILSFRGIFSFIPEAEYHYQEAYITEETIGIDYVISIDFRSVGAFIAGKKIDVEVEISKGIGKKFVNGENYIIIFHSYQYPLLKEDYGLYKGCRIDLGVTEEGEKLIGSNSCFFSNPGEYPIYTELVFSNEDGQLVFSNEDVLNVKESKNKIPISGSEGWLTIEQNNRIFSLTLIIIALTLFSLFIRNKK